MIKLNQKILEQILEIGGRLLTAGGEAKNEHQREQQGQEFLHGMIPSIID